jgi:hypothetical protein
MRAEGIRPLDAYSLDDPITTDVRKRKIETIVRSPETKEISFYKPTRAWAP